MNTTDEQIRAIKRQFRKAMNGIVAASMREKGLDYRVNFGLTLPLLKRIAAAYPPDKMLAERLWSEPVRESKMLATWLYPPAEMDRATACRWVAEIPYPEIADICCLNLFSRLPYAAELAAYCLERPDDLARYTGFRLWNRLLAAGCKPSEAEIATLLTASQKLLAFESNRPTLTVAVDALRRLAEQDAAAHKQIENFFSAVESDLPEENKYLVREILG